MIALKIVALYLPVSFAALLALWIMYLAVMGLQRAQEAGTLAPFATYLGDGLLYAGLIWDVLCNLLIGTILFMDIPRELTLSGRLRRLVLGNDGWRRRWSAWFAVTLLNPFSNGGPHIPLT